MRHRLTDGEIEILKELNADAAEDAWRDACPTCSSDDTEALVLASDPMNPEPYAWLVTCCVCGDEWLVMKDA